MDGESDHDFARRLMVAEIRAMGYETGGYQFAAPISEQVLAVMARVPRHRFVTRDAVSSAYYNQPLPIGYGQTISQPYIVALMTDLLALDGQKRVLEIGTGSGYQTAILAELAGRVYSVEIIAPLAERAAGVLHEQGYANIELRAGDGSSGWPERAPFDAIIVTAAAEHVPQTLYGQLGPGGRMIIPLGGHFGQDLIMFTRNADGSLERKNILPVRFVPLTGGKNSGHAAGNAGPAAVE